MICHLNTDTCFFFIKCLLPCIFTMFDFILLFNLLILVIHFTNYIHTCPHGDHQDYISILLISHYFS